ncbi:MAG: cytidylate kinase family protein [Syntrophobacteraceae bacterium]|jgi:cytidylate kinase
MAIIAISRGSYSKGKEVAERVADRLGYRCISREVIIEASRDFNIPEIKLHRAIHDAPSIFEKLTSITYGREKYISYFETALLRFLQKDNVVYHGFGGHFFIKDIPHALKVRIIADMEERVRLVMTREGISRERAWRRLVKDAEERKKWSLHLYGIDTTDPNLFDLLLLIKNISIDDAIGGICYFAQLDTFRTTFESQKAMDDLVLAAEVKATLINLIPDIKVVAKDGIVTLSTTLTLGPLQVQELRKIERSISGVKSIDVKLSHSAS